MCVENTLEIQVQTADFNNTFSTLDANGPNLPATVELVSTLIEFNT